MNVIVFQLATGERCWYIVECYLAPRYGGAIQDVEAEMTKRPRVADLTSMLIWK